MPSDRSRDPLLRRAMPARKAARWLAIPVAASLMGTSLAADRGNNAIPDFAGARTIAPAAAPATSGTASQAAGLFMQRERHNREDGKQEISRRERAALSH